MTKRRTGPHRPPRPRPRAAAKAAPSNRGNIQRLLHELQVHAEEITVQNELLIRAQEELEQARDRYADLYDLAPIGYTALDQDGVILDVNLSATELFGRPREFLVGLPLANLIGEKDRDVFRGLFVAARSSPVDNLTVEVDLRGSPRRTVQLFVRAQTLREGRRELFTALIDVTHERQLEAERRAGAERDQKRTAELQQEIQIRLIAEDHVKALMERLVNVQEEERRRLALNLHDELGQQLTALRLTLDAVKHAPAGSAQQLQRFEQIEQIITRLDHDVDALAWELRPPALDAVGLDAALRELLRQWSSSHRVVADLHVALPEDQRLPSEVESQLYRIVQEALNNVSKHAAAKSVSLMLERRTDEVTLIIEDDGRGFDADAFRKPGARGMGLVGMRERAATLHGDVQVESAPGNGTTVFVRVPLKTAAARAG